MVINSGARIRWCFFTERCIRQTLAGYRLTPSNFSTQLTEGSEGLENVFDLLCRKICCYFPENPQFGKVVYPKLRRRIERIFRDLHDQNVIVIYM